ncbi:arylamine N-acetyltransferase family protein [Dactylosporangium sp. CS-033363]|uniref:arylamine N-acetyltransferase family protein n=1 Tax=Dactylosporangium sp. CS-033363 TaxID=3239935 RepID=UPI003D8C3C60
MDDYLARIGAARPAEADLAALRTLQRAHLGTVPFENLSIGLGEPVVLDGEGLLDKIVRRRRGGFCYEVNGAFALLLRSLGYDVSLHSARTWNGSGYGFPFDHLALKVRLGGEDWLVDVGFGKFAHHPLRLATTQPQDDPGGVYTVTPHDEGHDVAGPGGPEYRIDSRSYALSDFGPTCWFHQTSPQSHFTRSLTCSRLTDDGRLTLAGDKLIHTTAEGREERVLSKPETLLVYRQSFGIALSSLPAPKFPA